MASSLNHSFDGKRVLVTGGASGIGLAIVTKFYSDGALVFVLDRDEQRLKELKENMPNVHTICVDLQNWDETKKAVESLVPLDHLVNNAGIAKRKPLIEIAQDECDTLFDVLVKAVLNVSQAFVKTRINHENKNGATIVNIASIAGQIAFPGSSIYGAAKAAVIHLTKCMASEFGSAYGIRVNCVAPGAVPATNIWGQLPNSAQKLGILKACETRCMIKESEIKPDDIANVVLFLSSPLAGKITAETIAVDCGYSAT